MITDRVVVVGLTGVPRQETCASASGNGRSARGPCAASCAYSVVFLSFSSLPLPSLSSRRRPFGCLWSPSAGRGMLPALWTLESGEFLYLTCSRSCCALVTDCNSAGSSRDPPSNTCRCLAALLHEAQELGLHRVTFCALTLLNILEAYSSILLKACL